MLILLADDGVAPGALRVVPLLLLFLKWCISPQRPQGPIIHASCGEMLAVRGW